MKANIGKLEYSNKVHIDRKENSLHRQWSIVDRDTGRELVICRTYYPGTVAYCCLWVHCPDAHGSGSGRAGGGGYHKESAALSDAIQNAGIVLDEPIAGHGYSAMESALEAIARAGTGKRKFFMVRAHG